MEPYLQLFVGSPLTDPLRMAADFFENAVITKTTSTKIVLMDEDGGKVVFFGDYTVNGEITGTMTGFKYKDEGTKLIEGGGFEVDAAELLDALEGGDLPLKKIDPTAADVPTIFDLLLPGGILIEGSDQRDVLQRIDADGAVVKGRKGDDLLVGGDGNQVLKGNKGNDFLGGGGEQDKLFGGKGNDVFALGFDFASPFEAVELPVVHKIKDFSHKDDTINLAFKDLGFGFLDKDLFKKGTEATSLDHRIIYDEDTGRLYYDEDGSDIMEQIHIGTLTPGTNLKANDIFAGGVLFEA